MPRTHRLAFLAVAVVIAVVAIIVLAGRSEDNGASKGTGDEQSATSTATPSGRPSPTAPPSPLLQSGTVAKITAKQGDTVTFRVSSPVAEEVHVHTYDIKKELEPNVTATVSLKADITGIFEIEFEHSGEQIAELRVNPG